MAPPSQTDHDLLISIAVKMDMLLAQFNEQIKQEEKIHDEMKASLFEHSKSDEAVHNEMGEKIRSLELRVVRLMTVSGLVGATGGTVVTVVLSTVFKKMAGG